MLLGLADGDNTEIITVAEIVSGLRYRAIGLSERDGVIALAGMFLAGLAILLTGGMAWAALTALQLPL